MADSTTQLDYVGYYELLDRLKARHPDSRIPDSWIRRQAKAGLIPHLRIGRRMFFSIAAVEAAIARLASGPAAGQADLPHPATA